ncbi:SbmA/BacA-like family transporter [Coleofasciculus sp. F4-SAH-05]|uniref:SbmA/BacA-like family transporter n=1 Tax=Coleofasciculus sp. F4-SAH-05 TaxID=3069525 RepID=UPI0033043C58
MDRLNFKVLQQFWTIAKSYWLGDEKWLARGLLLSVVLFLLAYTGLSVLLNFRDRAYYNLHIGTTEIDNPDQRIAEDVRSFTQESLTFLLVLVESVLSVIAFSRVLWGISKPLVFFLVLYALIGTLVTTMVFGKPLVRLNFEQLKREANLRFSLVRIRENAEAIAFYQWEEQESNQVKQRFFDVFENVKRYDYCPLLGRTTTVNLCPVTAEPT